MNQNTVVTIAVIGGLAVVGYLVYKNNKKTSETVVQVSTPGNTAVDPTAQIISAGSDALKKVADIFGA